MRHRPVCNSSGSGSSGGGGDEALLHNPKKRRTMRMGTMKIGSSLRITAATPVRVVPSTQLSLLLLMGQPWILCKPPPTFVEPTIARVAWTAVVPAKQHSNMTIAKQENHSDQCSTFSRHGRAPSVVMVNHGSPTGSSEGDAHHDKPDPEHAMMTPTMKNTSEKKDQDNKESGLISNCSFCYPSAEMGIDLKQFFSNPQSEMESSLRELQEKVKNRKSLVAREAAQATPSRRRAAS